MMTYTAKRLEDQTLMFKITTEHNGKEISFNVACANNESEIPDLIDVYINFLDATPPVYSQQTPIADLNTIVQELTARLEVLENK